MKLSLNWIKEFVDIQDGFDLSKLVYDLTMSTVEVEETIRQKDMFDKMVIGIVREIKAHPDADKLVLCQVDLGEGMLREIVCGGINLKTGMKVAVARPGAYVRWHGEGDLIELKIAKVRGVESYGMICASSEIGLFDLFPYTEESTIVDLSGFDADAGDDLASALGLDDTILVIDNKSLTNRPDLWGHYGMARELSAIYDLPLKEIPATSSLEKDAGRVSFSQADKLKIEIADADLCPRYLGVKIQGVSQKPAPFEIQKRLWSVGLRPINAIVDITNYIMLETGQPTHAFDADVIKGGIIIRPAKNGEKLLLLSGAQLTLTTDDLVIADETEAIALAGVMGGGKDSVLDETENVILEIANFNPLSVRHTAMRYDVRTEAATRYEKGIDPQRVEPTLSKALQMFADVFPDMAVTAFCDNYPKPLEKKTVQVSLKWLERRMGRKLPQERIQLILERLGFGVDLSGDTLAAQIPSWRSTGDVSLPDDIMEEIARIYGLENFEPTPIVTAFTEAVNQPEVDIDRRVREYLAKSCGMFEIYTYPWVGEDFISATLGDTGGMLEMAAPPSPGERFIRKSLIPGLCKAVSDNLRFFDEFSLFESTTVIFDKDYKESLDGRESLPLQKRYIGGAFAAPSDGYALLYKRVKGIIEELAHAVRISPLVPADAQAEKPVWADDVIYQNIISNGSVIGSMGLLSQKAALACGIKNTSVMLFEIDIDAIDAKSQQQIKYQPVPEYPSSGYDISLLFDKQIKWEDIRKTTAGKPGPDNLVRDVGFVEEYKGSKIPGDKKSITLRLIFGSSSKTLKSDEIEASANAIVKRLCKTLGAERRN